MEPAAAAWAPYCEFQLANWSIDQEPPAGLPAVEYAAPIDIPGTCVEACVPEYYYYSAASQHNAVTSDQTVIKISKDIDPQSVVDQITGEFRADIDMMKKKMHRYPACLRDVGKYYTAPRIVAIGPYHHGTEQHLKKAEKVKHAAACHCASGSGRLLEELYGEVVPVADDALRFYDKEDVVERFNHEQFLHMMFLDACFLVQYMLATVSSGDVDESLTGFFSTNHSDIFHDVMLLENQLPWHVVETVISFMGVASLPREFIRLMRNCMLPDDLSKPLQQKPFVWYGNYEPPHLLGLFRYHIVGRSDLDKIKEQPNIQYSFSAMELAEIGITLAPNKTVQLIDMTLNQKGTLLAELSLAPLSLDRNTASYLVNMAAFELCTVLDFLAVEEDSAVCSYLLLLAKLVYREEDVHELRERDLLQGGGGLTNAETLNFFSSFQGLHMAGPCYLRVMDQIQIYRVKYKGAKTKMYSFWHRNKKIIIAAGSAFG